jgi:drug/metabolite transporter (DMT)-like permease
MFFYAIMALPLATAMTLNYTSPLFLAVFTAILLREPVKPLLAAALLLGFGGIVLLLNPSLDGTAWLGSVLGLLSGLFAGLAYLQVTQLGRMGEPEWRTVFYFTLVCTLGSGLWLLTKPFRPVPSADLGLLVAMGAAATLAQLAMTKAYREGDSLVVGSLAYSTVIFASLFGVLLWHDHLSADQWLAIGLVIASGILSVSMTRQHGEAKESAR